MRCSAGSLSRREHRPPVSVRRMGIDCGEIPYRARDFGDGPLRLSPFAGSSKEGNPFAMRASPR